MSAAAVANGGASQETLQLQGQTSIDMDMDIDTNTTSIMALDLEIINDSLWKQTREELVLAIRNVLNLRSLKPCPPTNAAFTHLVDAVINHRDTDGGSIYDVLEKELVHRVREVAGLAECELETMWARRIATSPAPAQTLAEFPYYGNYEKLVTRELELLSQSGLRIHRHSSSASLRFRVMFVGSGPLSMTSIILHKILPHAYIQNVDVCKKAIGMSESVAGALGLRSQCGFSVGDGATITIQSTTSTKFDLILVAALAGTTQLKKQEIIDNLRPALAPGGRVLLRSARGARELLYPVVHVNKLEGVKVLAEYHPDDDVINSVIVCSLI